MPPLSVKGQANRVQTCIGLSHLTGLDDLPDLELIRGQQLHGGWMKADLPRKQSQVFQLHSLAVGADTTGSPL